MSKIEKAIANLLIKSSGEIKSRLHEVECKFAINNTSAIGHCYCVKLDGNGNTRVDDLIDFMVDKIVDYSIPKGEIAKAREEFNRTGSTSKILSLQRKARELFTNLKKTGEGGELLLYILVQHFLELPQLISKMSLKTSGQLHYQGVDGIHVGYDSKDNSLIIYWGESKMYKSLEAGLKSCFQSLKSFLTDTLNYKSAQERDIQLITSNISQNINDEVLENLLVRYFDKDDDLSNHVKYKGICFVGFDSEKYPDKPNTKTLDDLTKDVKKDVAGWFSAVEKNILKNKTLELFEIHVFLIPFPSVEKFRKSFIEQLKS